ncbi:GNAT family N-acetyltransferase [Carboxylicivirga sp. A043]|uniref:GNAT family N-acetyltransferase n=1 Tax=Carboxylicivirga litoralis TaxID=2816963 RepID=UPI0021CAE867|nr:GNAT family N-acetyltransferase [Carboxylicivirga sp. A043]MCU4157134.1 GNAT family N-acetyltransferase [Carboxylicivirga sp. A043]
MIDNSNSEPLRFKLINLKKQKDQRALFTLMNAYMLDKMGIQKPMSQSLFQQTLTGLRTQCNYIGILVYKGETAVGLANCFINFSTFKGLPLINIHDFIVLPEAREKGVGRFLLQSIKEIARQKGCCKVNLEVREDNLIAQGLYQTEGFNACCPNMYFWEFLL